jgi:hypothetical protein
MMRSHIIGRKFLPVLKFPNGVILPKGKIFLSLDSEKPGKECPHATGRVQIQSMDCFASGFNGTVRLDKFFGDISDREHCSILLGYYDLSTEYPLNLKIQKPFYVGLTIA